MKSLAAPGTSNRDSATQDIHKQICQYNRYNICGKTQIPFSEYAEPWKRFRDT